MTRSKTMIILLLATCTIFSGCGLGYNETLFVTKNNVGLDADTKPPTLELSIARREAVISPTFEEGKTPPVLASFSVNVSGLPAMFAAVSSTFAGGDAALTMARLYDATDDDVNSKCSLPDSLDSKEFESAFNLDQVPIQHDRFGKEDTSKKLLEPGEVKPFLFETDTLFGIKAVWSGMTAPLPDTVRIGYNRKEFALAPVTMKGNPTDNEPNSVSVKMPSFLATIDNSSDLKTASSGKIKHLQYFATGEASKLLARQYGVRKAMAKRLDIISAEESPKFTEKYKKRTLDEKEWTLVQLSQMYDFLKERSEADPKDQRAIDLIKDLNQQAPPIPDKYDVILYAQEGNQTIKEVALSEKPLGLGNNNDPFKKALVYSGGLLDCAKRLKKLLVLEDLKLISSKDSTKGETTEKIPMLKRMELIEHQKYLELQSQGIVEKLNKEQAVDNAVQYYKTFW